MLLIAWVVLLILYIGVYPGVPICLYGLFFIGILIPSSERLYYLKVLVLFLLLIGAQITTLILTPNWNNFGYRYTFYGISAIALGANGVIFSMVLWLTDGREWNLDGALSFVRE